MITDFICDGNSLYARSWYAAQRVNSDPAEALRLALQTLLLLLNPDSNRIGAQFDRMLFGWDGAQRADKHREPKPAEYYQTRDIFKDVLTLLFGCAHGECAEYEGDDVVATAVYNTKANAIYVVSGDKDLQQLQGGRVRYYCLNTKGLLSDHWILSRWNVKRPEQIALALAVIGDPVDNIKGIPKWGPVRCKKLFEAVTEDMNIDEAVAAIDRQIPNELKTFFYESLDRTLLNFNVPGIPEPAPIVLAEPSVLEDLGIPGIDGFYAAVYNSYMLEPF